MRAKGFTLIELLVAVALAMVLSGSIAFVAMQTQRIYTESVAKVELYSRIRYAFSRMENELSRMIRTSDLEFFRDQRNVETKSNSHWDPGEEVRTLANTAGGFGGNTYYNEGPEIVERYYTRVWPHNRETQHAAFEIYFRAPTHLGNRLILANIEYRLVKASDLVKLPPDTGDVPYTRDQLPPVTKVDGTTQLSLVRIIRYLKPGLDIVRNAMWTRLIKTHISELCSNVVDFKIEYYARNPYKGEFRPRAGWFTPKKDYNDPIEPLARPFKKVVVEQGTKVEVYVKEFVYGSSRQQPTFGRPLLRGIIRKAIKIDPLNPRGIARPAEFQVQRLHFCELNVGDTIYLWRNSSGDYFPGGEFTIKNIVQNGRLRFFQPIDTSSWKGDKTGIQFKAGYLPSALRLTLVLSDRRGKNPYRITRVVKITTKRSG